MQVVPSDNISESWCEVSVLCAGCLRRRRIGFSRGSLSPLQECQRTKYSAAGTTRRGKKVERMRTFHGIWVASGEVTLDIRTASVICPLGQHIEDGLRAGSEMF